MIILFIDSDYSAASSGHESDASCGEHTNNYCIAVCVYPILQRNKWTARANIVACGVCYKRTKNFLKSHVITHTISITYGNLTVSYTAQG